MFLSAKTVRWLRTTLLSHHSQDPGFFRFGTRTMTSKSMPWKCRFCRKLVKASSTFCPHCGGQWESCLDPGYVHQHGMEGSADQWSSWPSSWEEGWARWDQRPKSPRRVSSPRRKGKGKGKDKGKPKDELHGGSVAPSLQSLPSPPTLPQALQGGSQPSSSLVSPFQVAKKALLSKEEQELQTLRALAKTLKTQQAGLPEEVVRALHASEEAAQKETTRSYRDLITALGSARKHLADLDQEWEDFRSQWSNYMDLVSKTWIEQAESFEKGEEAFASKRKEAIERIQELRTKLNVMHQKTMKTETIADETEQAEAEMAQTAEMENDEQAAEAARIESLKLKMTGAVQVLKESINARVRPRSRSARRKDGDEDDCQIVEPPPKHTKTQPQGGV